VLHSPPEPDTHKRNPEVFLRKPDGSWWYNGMAGGDAKLKKLLASCRERYGRYDDAYERAASATDLFEVLDDLAPLIRAAANMSQALQSARELVKGDRLLIAMRDEAYEVSRSYELLFHDAKLALDYRIARTAEAQMAKATEMAVAQHKLNVLAAVTFPLMAIATILGMNVAHGLEDRSPGIFWAVLLLGIGVGMMAVYWVTSQSEAGARMRDRMRSGLFE
jgi:Mg2+ and Co2+ transporter CorA